MKKPGITFKTWSGILVVLALLMLLMPSVPKMAQAIPSGPDCFYGILSLDESPAPAGITITAKVNGIVVGTSTTQAGGIYGSFEYPLLVQSNSSITLDGSSVISFYANGAQCIETASFVTEGVIELNLTSFAPYTSGWEPARGASVVPVNTNIVVHVRDDGTGVNQSTIKLTVNGSQVTPSITGTPANYTVTYDPPTNFGFGQVVNVSVDAKDRAGTPNAMPADSYSFTTDTDTTPPYTSAWYPAKNATGVPANTNIVVHVLDAGTGVNQTTIKLTVNGSQVTPSITGTPADYTVTYDPPGDFGFGLAVNVAVDAKDLASTPNVMPTDSYSFTTAIDGTAPFTSGWGPSDGETGVPIDANISLRVRDGGSGVDISTIEMRVGTNYNSRPIVTPAITGTPANYTLTYNPPSNFGYGQKVYVRVAAEDFSNNPMTFNYSFTTEGSSTTPSETNPPYTSGWDPAKNATGVMVYTDIVVHVRDAGAGVDFSTIIMTVDDEQVASTITGTPADYTVTYNRPTNFGYGQAVNITVDAQDLSNPPNTMPTDSYSFTTGELGALQPIQGLTYEVKNVVLPGVTVKLFKGGVEIGSDESDAEGKYSIIIPETGDLTLQASKSGFRDETQAISIPALGQEYTLNFKGMHGLIPNTVSMWYLLDCAALWKYPSTIDSEFTLDMWTLLDVAAAWKYPLP